MKILIGIAFVVGCAVILIYAAPAIVETVKWYLRRRDLVNRYGIQNGLSLEEAKARLPGTWEEWDSELTGSGEVVRYSCTLENGPVLAFCFVNGRLYSWHTEVEPFEPDQQE